MTTSKSALARVAHAADTHAWDLSVLGDRVMATRDSGRVGEPWVVTAVRASRGMQVSFFRPGDALDAEGEEIDELSGNPREMGRQLRNILEDLAEGATA